jgi:hypothetical protein
MQGLSIHKTSLETIEKLVAPVGSQFNTNDRLSPQLLEKMQDQIQQTTQETYRRNLSIYLFLVEYLERASLQATQVASLCVDDIHRFQFATRPASQQVLGQ